MNSSRSRSGSFSKGKRNSSNTAKYFSKLVSKGAMLSAEFLSSNAKPIIAFVAVVFIFTAVRNFYKQALHGSSSNSIELPDHAIVLSDSMCQFMTSNDHMTVHAFPGTTTAGLAHEMTKDPTLMAPITVLHVGTNDLGSKHFWMMYTQWKDGLINNNEYEQAKNKLSVSVMTERSIRDFLIRFRMDYQRLLKQVKLMNPETVVLASAILPRVYDYESSTPIIKQMNEILETMILKEGGLFIDCTSDFHNSQYFRPDGLHLTIEGTKLLQRCFQKHLEKL